jgi:hypothetical protein
LGNTPSSWFSGQWPGRDDRVGGVVFGFPAVPLLDGNVKDFMTVAGFAKTGGVESGGFALAGGRRLR